MNAHYRGRFSDVEPEKLRGGYYTSARVAAWLCEWAIRTRTDSILEPSCGDGVFLEAAAKRLIELGARRASVPGRLAGVEIVAAEAAKCRERLRLLLRQQGTGNDVATADKVVARGNVVAGNNIVAGDFFEWWKRPGRKPVDVVAGNPPFIRYQNFPEPHRARAMAIMSAAGLTPNRLTNIWVPFVVAAAAGLRSGGRLALVLPAELLQVTYAAQLRSFLTDRFARIDIVACNELLFDDAEQEVVLLLADGALRAASETNDCRVTLSEIPSAAQLTGCPSRTLLAHAEPKSIRHDREKWLKYFLTARQISFMRALRTSGATADLSRHAGIDVGVVTGKNEFFVLNGAQVAELGLTGHTTPLVSRSAHLKGAQIDRHDWNALAAAGDRVYLLNLQPERGSKLPARLAKYLRSGEDTDVHKGYKCSIREPWYIVPSVWAPDGFLFRQIYDFPRAVLNSAGATSTDTIHRLTCRHEDTERVIANTYTWLTAASAEIEGRSYGGGVLELEPTEAERLLMPSTLNGAMPLGECDKLTRAGRIDEVLEENARVVLRGHMGLSEGDTLMLRDIWNKMRGRRLARRRAR
ncbi:MAG: N-6 DNA methylase [Steroidobacteraceae bacterium]